MRAKVPASIIVASKLLFSTLVEKYGGSSEVGRKTGLSRQYVNNFIVNGYVPLIQVYSIAKALKLSVWHLSYYKLMEVFGSESPNFRKLVHDLTILTKDEKERILKVLKK